MRPFLLLLFCVISCNKCFCYSILVKGDISSPTGNIINTASISLNVNGVNLTKWKEWDLKDGIYFDVEIPNEKEEGINIKVKIRAQGFKNHSVDFIEPEVLFEKIILRINLQLRYSDFRILDIRNGKTNSNLEVFELLFENKNKLDLDIKKIIITCSNSSSSSCLDSNPKSLIVNDVLFLGAGTREFLNGDYNAVGDSIKWPLTGKLTKNECDQTRELRLEIIKPELNLPKMENSSLLIFLPRSFSLFSKQNEDDYPEIISLDDFINYKFTVIPYGKDEWKVSMKLSLSK